MSDMSHRLQEMTLAVENVLVASHAPMHDLLQYHQTKGTKVPPFETNSGELTQDEKRESAMVIALAHYGPGPIFNLWTMVRALDQLRAVWTGVPNVRPAVVAPPPPEPTLLVEPAAPEAA